MSHQPYVTPPPGPTPQRAVGVVISFDFTRDRELWRWAPEHVTLHLARTERVPLQDSLHLVTDLNDPALLAGPADVLLEEPVRCEVVLYACTAGSFVGGMSREGQLRSAMRTAGAPQAVTTSSAVLEALRLVGARTVAVAHPYVPPIGERLTAFLTEAGLDVVRTRGLGLPSRVIGGVDYASTAEHIVDSDHDAADAVFVPCTLLPTYDLIAPLEAALGKPVITANQVGIWAALRCLGVDAVGPGQRLVSDTPAP